MSSSSPSKTSSSISSSSITTVETTSSSSSSTTSSSSTVSNYSSNHGSFIVLGSTTIINSASTITLFHTITASSTNRAASSGISSKDKGIAIGVGVGIGVPVVAAIIVILLLLYRRKQRNSVRNYVDSNGRDVGIAVDEGNFFKRAFRHAFMALPTLKNNPTPGDFDDDNDDIINEPKPNYARNEDTAVFNRNSENMNSASNLNSNSTSNRNNSSNVNSDRNTGFFVDRPRPLRLVNISTDDESEPEFEGSIGQSPADPTSGNSGDGNKRLTLQDSDSDNIDEYDRIGGSETPPYAEDFQHSE